MKHQRDLNVGETLRQKSIDVLLSNQSDNGAFLACPTYPTYHFCWFRDGSYIAHALLSAGQTEAAMRFHEWVGSTIADKAADIEWVVRQVDRNRDAGRSPLEGVSEERLLHTRYRADGTPGAGFWENFQLDGFGTWLWALGQFAASGQTLTPRLHRSAGLAARYLTALGDLPCYDLWEEHRERHHSYTFASIVAGLDAYETLGSDASQVPADTFDFRSRTRAVRQMLFSHLETAGSQLGYFPKFCEVAEPFGVDASVVALAVPYRLFDVADPLVRASIAKLEETLLDAGGVHRYVGDTFYGGGRWILLSCLLAWYYRVAGRGAEAGRLLSWVEGTRTDNDELPEQESSSLFDPDMYRPWVEKWGTPAAPLLWSHAMYILATGTSDIGVLTS